MKKYLLSTTALFIFYFYANVYAPFSPSDLAGTWSGHTLVSGNAGWKTSTIIIDNLGNAVFQWQHSSGEPLHSSKYRKAIKL